MFHAPANCNYGFGFLAALNALEEPGPDGQNLLMSTRNCFNAFSQYQSPICAILFNSFFFFFY